MERHSATLHVTPDAELAEFKQAMEDWDWVADLRGVCEEAN